MDSHSTLDDHSRTIIHIDIDCFYAQVEINKNPALASVPLGIQQKNIVVTSNYIARNYGINKCMLVSEALKACPMLQLVRGEDLHDYRQVSYKITNYLHKYSQKVERLGLDENYVDVTDLVQSRLQNVKVQNENIPSTGHVYGLDEICECGCKNRLILGSYIAKEIRDGLKNELNLTSCAGIAHNKLLAKIAGSKNKPNQQTLVYPLSAAELILSLDLCSNIPGIGKSTAEQLSKIGVNTVEDLQNCDLAKLNPIFGYKANDIWNLSFGYDNSPVVPSEKPASIGLEDSCKPMSVETEIQAKLQQLLTRLMVLVAEDGRIPRSMKLTVRKLDYGSNFAHRETKQCKINPALFRSGEKINLSKESEVKLMKTVMMLFSKIIDIHKPFHVTLLGLSFTKFNNISNSKSTITKFLRRNVEVQSLTNIYNKIDVENVMDCSSFSGQSDINTDGSEYDSEPSPKKSKMTLLIEKCSRASFTCTDDLVSPSKLKVAELRLSCKDLEPSEECTSSKSLFVAAVTKDGTSDLH